MILALLMASLLALDAGSARGVSSGEPARPLGQRITAAAGDQPTWVVYRVPMVPARAADVSRSATVCCSDSVGGHCRLEGPDGITMTDGGRGIDGARGAGRTIPVEPSSELLVFAHVAGGTVDRLRIFTADCAVDAGGARLVSLSDVRPDDSSAWLATLAATPFDGVRQRHLVQPALAALALHSGDAASAALVSLAHDNRSARLRGQALFWLAQRAGNRAAAAITDAIANDPDTGVRKRAVFALSQLPKDEGVPLLIRVARTSRNPAVRRQAMFWLGESRDPRAVSFFEEILKR
ncbi:MAG: HEAT repeat domain-containing protein [Betaproteobacteria bacterium]